MDYTAIRQLVIDTALRAQRDGLIKGAAGNISLRSEDKKVIAITPSAIPYSRLNPEDIPLVDSAGHLLDGHTKPSSELLIHLAAMNARPDCNAVVHTHSMYATIYAATGKTLKPVTIPHLAHGISPTKISPFRVPGSQELADVVIEGLGASCKAVFMENHGLVAIGKDMEDAYEGAVYTEEAAMTAVYMQLLGTFKPIPAGALDEMQKIMDSGRAL